MIDTKNRYCVIMAGGAGTRFWPLGRAAKPKQFLDILGTGRTFIRQTVDRFAKAIPIENFIVVTNSAYKELVLEQVPELDPSQVLSEPIGRNTAPCIAYAACHIKAKNPDAIMVVTPSDHLILNEQEFLGAIEQGIEFVKQQDVLMTIGIQPSRPDTGYGYIQTENQAEANINKVKTFTEKPNLEMAKVFVDSGDFLWNAGIFIWKVETIIEALREFVPDNQELFDAISQYYNTPLEQEAIDRIYPECQNISIDFGVMEKAQNVYVRSSDCGWSDVGTWGAFYAYNQKDENDNVCDTNVLSYNTSGCIIKAPQDHVVIVDSLKDFLVVAHDKAIMICPRENEQDIKQYIGDLKYKTGGKFY
ncbi:MAG: mannose-1-phosphate guanylyltransferase [Rikenellaceae bacterium]